MTWLPRPCRAKAKQPVMWIRVPTTVMALGAQVRGTNFKIRSARGLQMA